MPRMKDRLYNALDNNFTRLNFSHFYNKRGVELTNCSVRTSIKIR